MELQLSHGVTYTNRRRVPVEVVARTLLAHDRLLQESIRLLPSFVDGVEVQRVDVSVELVSHGSPLKEVFAIALVMAYQQDLQREIPALVERITGTTVREDLRATVTVLVLMVALYAISTVVERLCPGSLYGKRLLVGSVTVVEERTEEGDFVPKEYILRRVDEAAD